MADRDFDATDERIKCALSALADGAPTVGKSEGWNRIQGALYPRPTYSRFTSRWRIVLVSLVAVVVIAFGLVRIPTVNSWSWRVVFASRDSWGLSWQVGGKLESIKDFPFVPLVVAPEAPDWTLQATAVDVREGAESVIALRYRHAEGAVFTLRETPFKGTSMTPNYDARDPRQFLLKVGNSNVAFFLPSAELSSASWAQNGLHIEIWGYGGVQELMRLIEELVPYSRPTAE